MGWKDVKKKASKLPKSKISDLLAQLRLMLPDSEFASTVGHGVMSAVNRGGVGSVLGGPVDTVTAPINLAIMGGGYLGHKAGLLSADQMPQPITRPVGGSEWWGQQMQNAGMVTGQRSPIAETLAAFAVPYAMDYAGQKVGPILYNAELQARSNLGEPQPFNAMTRNQGGAIVYHGSPHKFDELDYNKIGSGEGAQAKGYGLYLADHPDTAGTYKFVDARIDPDVVTYGGRKLESLYNAAQRAQDIAHRMNNPALIEKANAEFGFWEKLMTRVHPDQEIAEILSNPDDWPALTKFVKSLDRAKFKGVEEAGNFYTADLPDEHIAKMLDLDKPLSKQPEILKAVGQKLIGTPLGDRLGVDGYGNIGLNALKSISRDAGSRGTDPATGEDLYKALSKSQFRNDTIEPLGPKRTSELLNSIGIPGNKYLDQGSRQAGEGTRNYVIFDDKLAKILSRNGEPVGK
jgi:hypothetical protein